MLRRNRFAAPLLALLALMSLPLVVSACGYESHEKEVVEGEPVELGELSYNAIFSRYLNPSDNEDSAYLVGQPPAPKGSAYFGVFFEVQNESEDPQTLAKSMTIEDADHETFEALPSKSLYAMPLGSEVEEQEQVPTLDSPPEQGPIEGSVVLFLLPESANEARPLTLSIPGPEGPGEVTLDL